LKFEQEFSLKGLIFAYNTKINVKLLDPNNEVIYSKENSSQVLFVHQAQDNGLYQVVIQSLSNYRTECMVGLHFGKLHSSNIMKKDLESINDFMNNFKIYSNRFWYIVNY